MTFVQNTYSAFFFVTLKPWSERTKPEEQYDAIKMRLAKELAGLTDGIGFAFPPPAIPGAGTSGGFSLALEDRSGKDMGSWRKTLASSSTPRANDRRSAADQTTTCCRSCSS